MAETRGVFGDLWGAEGASFLPSCTYFALGRRQRQKGKLKGACSFVFHAMFAQAAYVICVLWGAEHTCQADWIAEMWQVRSTGVHFRLKNGMGEDSKPKLRLELTASSECSVQMFPVYELQYMNFNFL